MKLIVYRYNQNPDIVGVFDWKNIDTRNINQIQLCCTDNIHEGPRAFTRENMIFFMMKTRASFDGSCTLYGIGEKQLGDTIRIRWYDENCVGHEVEERKLAECGDGLKRIPEHGRT